MRYNKLNTTCFLRSATLFFLCLLTFSMGTMAQDKKQLVRIAVIVVDSTQLSDYNEFLTEEIEASIRLEQGVITLYAVAESENPANVTLFETYADSTQYKDHLVTPHFQKYKTGTLNMVKHLELMEVNPIMYIRKPYLEKSRSEDFFIRLIKIKIDSTKIERFNRLAKTVMAPGIQKEQGVLMMYAVAEKNEPTNISVLEVYADAEAYENHLKTSHFIKYKTDSKPMIRSFDLIDVKPILLGSKPQEKAKQGEH